MRKLTIQEIENFSNMQNVKKVAVEKFLMGMKGDLDDIMEDLLIEAKLYNWNRETISAILDGIWFAAGLNDETCFLG